MNTKFDVGEEVYIKGKIRFIKTSEVGTTYTVTCNDLDEREELTLVEADLAKIKQEETEEAADPADITDPTDPIDPTNP